METPRFIYIYISTATCHKHEQKLSTMSVDEVTAAGLDPWLFAHSLIDFSLNGRLPDDPELVGSNLTNSALERAREEVAKARSELQVIPIFYLSANSKNNREKSEP